MSPVDFVRRMRWAADIAWHDVSRAVTHNKGIFNGIDAVVLSTGNDFRAVEASGHAFASRTGQYRALSTIEINDDVFSLQSEVPMALGTVGGLTKLHPLASKTLQILKNPDAKTLMKIAGAVGLANNFAALASLVTTGIQQGHMKMHLHNIIQSLHIDPQIIPAIEEHFKDKTISVSAVREFVEKNH
jgi:hydroxymethylglutaryl-CoA reductase